MNGGIGLREAGTIAAILSSMLVIGTLGFHLTEGWSLFESVYATVITLTSVGYGDLVPVTPVGRVFAILLVAVGFGAVGWALSRFYTLILSDEARRALRRRRTQRMIDSLKGHVILCGYGQMGRGAARRLREQGLVTVVVDVDEATVRAAQGDGYQAIVGNASDDDILRRAGIERARALIACANSDAVNVFIALSARGLASSVHIIARADLESSCSKLERAGVDRVILPYTLGAERMANLVRRPNVADFIDVALHQGHTDLGIEEIRVPEGSPFVGKTLEETRARREFGVTVLAIARPGAPARPAPSAEDRIVDGSVLVCFGTSEGLERFFRRLEGGPANSSGIDASRP